LNSDLAADHIHTVIFPKIFLQYLEETVVDCQMTQQEFMHWLHVSTIDPSTAFCWLKNLGFCFDTMKKFISTIVTKILKLSFCKNKGIQLYAHALLGAGSYQAIMQNILNQKLI